MKKTNIWLSLNASLFPITSGISALFTLRYLGFALRMHFWGSGTCSPLQLKWNRAIIRNNGIFSMCAFVQIKHGVAWTAFVLLSAVAINIACCVHWVGKSDNSSKCHQGISYRNVIDLIREITYCALIKNISPWRSWHYISLLYCKKWESCERLWRIWQPCDGRFCPLLWVTIKNPAIFEWGKNNITLY